MNQADYLARIPQTLRKQIEAEEVYAPWLRQGHTLENITQSQVIMETVYNQMTQQERRVLQLIVSAIGSEPFDNGRLDKLAARTMSGADTKVGLLLLLKKGICFAFRKSWGEHVYRMAMDTLALWHQILFPSEDGEGSDEPTPNDIEITHSGGRGLTEDLFQTLVYLGQQPIKLTKGGSIPKRQLQKLGELISLNDEWLEGTGIKYVYADLYSYKIAVMMECLTRLQLIRSHAEILELDGGNVRSWLQQHETVQTAALYRTWKSAVFPGEAWMQHAVLWLDGKTEERWISWQQLELWLQTHQLLPNQPDGESAETRPEAFERMWLLPLIAFGWLEKGMDRMGSLYYRWRRHPLNTSLAVEEDAKLYVQPDFEILVPPDVSYSLRWELAQFSDQHTFDALSIYKVNKESIQRALENGRTLEEMLDFLTLHSMYEVPENVKLTLEQWAKPFGQLQLAKVILLRCETVEAVDTVRKLTASTDCFLEAVGDKAWIVKADQLGSLRAILDKAGWMPGKLVLLDGSAEGVSDAKGSIEKPAAGANGNGESAQTEWRLDLTVKGFLYSRHNIGLYEMEQRLPHIAELYPDLNGIPSSWMKDYRTYHASTRREMVEKAMEWKAAVQVRHNGRDRLIAPRKLQETRGTWSMIGLDPSEMQEVCWLAEDWQEMKMILPGINDKY
ncbi:helicase-associated domain-containing protein [Paenibacillus sp. OAS669]|uniref:helicase-associated domain-containing protein n=1 Tax=Paenibacillus sp. OAS669 TaxID=2663821 RepID=UPI001789317A|nr:helicase-associated domain-containing protein [Paenibacillus sp. OAS669]MBE1446314.1 hypothetical protein [Paenibacillus sp. OAS669]